MTLPTTLAAIIERSLLAVASDITARRIPHGVIPGDAYRAQRAGEAVAEWLEREGWRPPVQAVAAAATTQCAGKAERERLVAAVEAQIPALIAGEYRRTVAADVLDAIEAAGFVLAPRHAVLEMTQTGLDERAALATLGKGGS